MTDGSEETVPATQLRAGDVVMVSAGELIPGDGDIVDGIASVDESAITGESAPVIRESGGDRSAVTAGTKVLSDWIKVRITAEPGESFLDRMIFLVEGAERQKTPNEIALSILLAKFTIIFLIVCVALQPFAIYAGNRVSDAVLIALFVCLIPTTIGGLLSAIGIAGMDRLVQHNVLAMSGRAVEAAGDVSTLLLDKTGTITLGNRQAVAFVPAPGVDEKELAEVAQFASLADETPEGRSIVVLAKERYGIRERELVETHAQFVPFTAQTRMSGVDLDGEEIRKGAVDAVVGWAGQDMPPELAREVERVSRAGGTPLAVAKNRQLLGMIELKDIIKEGLVERFAQLRKMGIRTVMITGDNPLTAAAIAEESGVDDFLAEATPETKMALIKKEQEGGVLVAMTGRRHERRPRARRRRRRRRDEHGHHRREGGRQHGRPRLQPHEAHGDRRDRQAAVDHARLAHDVLDRERRGEVLRDHPRDVHGHVPGPGQAERDEPHLAPVGDPVGRHLQRADHRAAGPARPARGEVPPDGRGRPAATQPVDLRAGRHHRALHRDQTHRHDPHGGAFHMMKIALRALVATILLAVLTGLVYPLVITGIAQLGMKTKADGSLVTVDGKIVGSSSIGQAWKGNQWFYGRPSAIDYDASTSSGSNLGPNNSDLEKDIADDAKAILKEEGPYTPGLTVAKIPADLLTASGSGLDPDISEAAAHLPGAAHRRRAPPARVEGAGRWCRAR